MGPENIFPTIVGTIIGKFESQTLWLIAFVVLGWFIFKESIWKRVR